MSVFSRCSPLMVVYGRLGWRARGIPRQVITGIIIYLSNQLLLWIDNVNHAPCAGQPRIIYPVRGAGTVLEQGKICRKGAKNYSKRVVVNAEMSLNQAGESAPSVLTLPLKLLRRNAKESAPAFCPLTYRRLSAKQGGRSGERRSHKVYPGVIFRGFLFYANKCSDIIVPR